MASGVNPLTNGATDSGVSSIKAKPDPLASKETFLQLLVAQLKNQNPMSPADGIEFVSQLAQFTELEQLMTIRQDVGAIRNQVDPLHGISTERSPDQQEKK
ncbi:MAG: hypothetical protein HUU41_01835 [Bryobacteraceae bacterium]|nr:hypothetical protein [Bryobacterales bacterium]MEB2361094.1 hypothetical protein [Bryobacterales bacterium]NUM99829.1 hypothetical protein [Bryobacteraceae bacterium]